MKGLDCLLPGFLMCIFAALSLFSSFLFQPQSKLQECELLCLMTDTRRQGNTGVQCPLNISWCVCFYFLPACNEFLLQMRLAHRLSTPSWAPAAIPTQRVSFGKILDKLSFCFLGYFPASLCTQEVRRSEISTGLKSKKLTVRFMTITRNCNFFGLSSCTEHIWKRKERKNRQRQTISWWYQLSDNSNFELDWYQ